MAVHQNATSDFERNFEYSSLTSGVYEPETTIYGPETDLKKDVECPKNPGHPHFIPIVSFTKDHFPPGYRQSWREEWVKAIADLTVHISVVSEYNPGYEPLPCEVLPHQEAVPEPQSQRRFGSGFVVQMYRSGEGGVIDVRKTCECDACAICDEPRKTWHTLKIITAAHVYFEELEIEPLPDTEVTFFFDKKEDKSKCVKVQGHHKKGVGVYVMGDLCTFDVVVHDEKIAERLMQALNRYHQLGKHINEGDPAVCVSHPHGLEKFVTIGQVVREEDDPMFGKRWPRFVYTCDTCPGSSGAGVGVYYSRWGEGRRAPHSQALIDGNNGSGSGYA